MSGTAGYRGARFYKCDLHLHTPADPSCWIGPRFDEPDAAEAFVRRCYETGLEVVAITDHNFASKQFLPSLRNSIARLKGEFGHEITLFPGFEITANVGKGCHVLAVLRPDLDVETIDHMLTQCRVDHPRFQNGVPRSSGATLSEILKVVQARDNSGRPKGIVICPHSQSDLGIFDTNRIAGWLQCQEFTNSELLCVEVPKPPSQMSDAWQRLFSSGKTCQPRWQRTRPIACIMSSDAKALTPEQDRDNYIGRRSTWIKMSRPSIEALRQAFLDHESRVRFGEDRPEEAYRYPVIQSIQVTGATFLADQQVVFSPNLTTVIGGRGTGKTTFVEYLRIALGQEAAITGQEPRDKLRDLRGTITTDTTLRVEMRKEGQVFVSDVSGGGPRILQEPDIHDIDRFFPARVLSQHEIHAIARERPALLRLIDDADRSNLRDIARREEDLTRQIHDLSEEIAQLPALERRLNELETEKRDFEVRIRRLEEVKGPFDRWKALATEEQFLQAVRGESAAAASALREEAKRLRFTSIAPLGEFPHISLMVRIAARSQELFTTLTHDVETAVADFEQEMAALLGDEEVRRWAETLSEERSRLSEMRQVLAQQGIDPDLYLNYQAEVRNRSEEIAKVKGRVEHIGGLKEIRDGRLGEGEAKRDGLITQLHRVWREAAEVRIKAAAGLEKAVPVTSAGSPFVRIAIEPFADEEALTERLREEVQDKRRISGDDWDSFVHAVFEVSSQGQVIPTETFASWVSELRCARRPTGCPWEPDDRRTKALLSWLTEDRVLDVRLWPTPDRIRVSLYRPDGSYVGQVEGPELSVGQRCTVILALLLARGEVPIVIDQPEEDLDNEFVFAELVPLLRRAKEKRQIIVVTHNANIPVNADAELVAALEVRGRRGCIMRGPDNEDAIGALDRDTVKRAVEDIMEGSEEAFRRRFEKYGF